MVKRSSKQKKYDFFLKAVFFFRKPEFLSIDIDTIKLYNKLGSILFMLDKHTLSGVLAS